MSKKLRRRTPLIVAAVLAVFLTALAVTFPHWGPLFLLRSKPPIEVSPRLLAPGVREGAEEAVSAQQTTVLRRLAFDRGMDSLKVWEKKVFKGETNFQVLNENGLDYLSSQSRDASTGLFVKTEQTATPDTFLSWKWRAKEFPQKKEPGKLSNRSEDDFAARIYVIFTASNFFRSDVIEYIWDEKFSPGTLADSPYSDRIKLLVIRSGPAAQEGGGWAEEERNVYQDFVDLFGKAPKNPLGMVAILSDSDNTKTSASADFAEIVLKRKQPRTAA